jgi:thioester reductase-like protein
MSPKHIMITGANGYLGYYLVRRYLSETDCRLTLLLNARNNETAHVKAERLFQRLDSDLPGVRAKKDVNLVFADLADYRLPDIACTPSITDIIHAAAVTRFDVPSEVAQAVNVDGTRRMLELARCCPRLEKFCLVSSLYASGLHGGLIAEDALDASSGFANNYERSKWAAEQLLGQDFSHLPWQICRVGLIASDDERHGKRH